MAKPFEHFLLTRFNIPWTGRKHVDPAWLAGRFELFEQFCWPSVCAQTEPGFRWLLFSDSSTPEPFRCRLQNYAAEPNVEVVVTANFNLEVIQATLRNMLSAKTEYIVTSRLDSDDAIAVDYVERLQEEVHTQTEFVNFLNGYVWQDGRVYERRYPSNPFVSFIEPVDELRTVFCEQHWRVGRVAPLRQILGKPTWLQVMHEGNLANRPAQDAQWQKDSLLGERFCINVSRDLHIVNQREQLTDGAESDAQTGR